MSVTPSEERLIRNEQTIRKHNTVTEKAIKKYVQNDHQTVNRPFAFTCECSMLDCNKRVKLSIAQYEKIHVRRDRFAIYPGHLTAKVERIVEETPEYHIVEKFDLSRNS